MPPRPIVIGEEFPWHSVANGDGGTCSLFVTVVDEAGRFTVRAEQTGDGAGAVLYITNEDGSVDLLALPIAEGSTALIRLEDSVELDLPFDVARRRVTLAGGAAATALVGGAA